jgi:hypothetical protein
MTSLYDPVSRTFPEGSGFRNPWISFNEEPPFFPQPFTDADAGRPADG